MNRFRKLLNVIAGILMLAGMSYYIYIFASAESRVRLICNQIKPGMSVEQLRQVASSNGMAPEPKESGLSFVVETKTFGRYGCEVITEKGFVKESTYIFAD